MKNSGLTTEPGVNLVRAARDEFPGWQRSSRDGDADHINTKETTMLRKIVLGVAAAAAVSAAAFSPTIAEAKPFKAKFWHPHHHFHGGYGLYGAYAFGGCMQKRWVPTPFGYRFRWVNVCY